jgi:hypothetical protein
MQEPAGNADVPIQGGFIQALIVGQMFPQPG